MSEKELQQEKAECEIFDYPEDYTSPNCKKYDERVCEDSKPSDKNKPA